MTYTSLLIKTLLAAPLIVCAFMAKNAKASDSLSWTSNEQELHAQSGEEKIFAVYSFRNTSSKAVRITSVATNCVCTVAKPSKDIYVPGERGELDIEFSIGSLVGRQERTLSVITDDAPSETHELKLVVDIDETISISPRLLFWKIGQALDEKISQISVTDAESTHLPEPRVNNRDFIVRLESKEHGSGKYLLIVKPVQGARPSSCVIHITVLSKGRVQNFEVFAAVK